MNIALPRMLAWRTIHILDVALVVWTIVWLGIAAYTAHEVNGLQDLSDTVTKTGIAVDTTGRALQSLGSVPLVGGRISTLADEVRAAGQSAVEGGRSSQGSIRNLSILLGVAIGLIPTVPALAIWLPLRLGWRRERRSVERLRRGVGADPAVEEFLARRAAQHLSFHELRKVSEHPWRDLEFGNFRRLADAELARLGLPALTGPADG